MRFPHPRRGLRLAPLLLLGAAACDIPTETPQWDTTWVVPADSAIIPVSNFLPTGVGITADRSAFDISLQGVTLTRTLGEMCGNVCTAANGATVPKPAFTTTFSANINGPAELASASISQAQIAVRLSHDFSFDPIRPSAGARGFIRVTATSGNVTLAKDSISGNDVAFGAGTTLNRQLTASAFALNGPVVITVTVNSPAGDPVRINTANRITVVATPATVRATDAQVRITSTQSFTGPSTTLGDLPDIADRVQAGAFRLDISNPFTATGVLNLSFTTAGAPVTRTIAVAAGASKMRVEFTRDELRSIFQAASPTVRVSGTFNAPNGLLTVRPSSELRVRGAAELVVSTESDS